MSRPLRIEYPGPWYHVIKGRVENSYGASLRLTLMSAFWLGITISCPLHFGLHLGMADYFDFVLNIDYDEYKLCAGGYSLWLRQQ